MAEIIVALDVSGRREALALVERLGSAVDFYKVGLELYTAEGPAVVRDLRAAGKRVFLDLKLHDIPNTVAGAVRSAMELDVDLLTVHATGGLAMMAAAAAAARNPGRPSLLGVTLLTSLAPDDVAAVWGRSVPSLPDEVVRLASLAREAGLAGVVASPWEAAAVRTALGPDALVVTPGIRLPGTDAHDQTRVASPADAARAGATHLVIGRAVTAASDPEAALAAVRGDLHAGRVEA